MGEAQSALDALKRAHVYATNDAAITENLAVAHLAAGEASVAEALLSHLIARGATSGLLHMRHGLALQQLGRLPEAEQALRLALQTAPGEADVYVNLSNVLAAREHIDEALAVLRDALSRWPGHRTRCTTVARCCSGSGGLTKPRKPTPKRCGPIPCISMPVTITAWCLRTWASSTKRQRAIARRWR